MSYVASMFRFTSLGFRLLSIFHGSLIWYRARREHDTVREWNKELGYSMFAGHQQGPTNQGSELLGKYGSVRGSYQATGQISNWLPRTNKDCYSRWFNHFRRAIYHVFERGLAVVDPTMVSNIGSQGQQGNMPTPVSRPSPCSVAPMVRPPAPV